MKQKANCVFLIMTLTSVLLTPNCATMIRKPNQRIPVTSSPLGATVIVNGIQQGVTPLELDLARKQKGQVIRIESPGYNPVEIRLKRELSSNFVLGNLFLGVAPGIVPAFLAGIMAGETMSYYIWALSAATFGGLFTFIDSSSGSGYGLRPIDLTVTLTKADGTPRVDTILVDADDLRNIKWIRVRRD